MIFPSRPDADQESPGGSRINRWAGAVRNEKGVALPLALIMLVSLIGLLLVLLSMTGSEPQIAANLTGSTQARYVADAGIDWAYDVLAATPNWNTVLLGPDGLPNTADDGVLATAMPLPGLPASSGTFSVSVRNDTQPGDTQITGVGLDADPVNDTNGRVIVTSVGVAGTTTRTIRVVLHRLDLPPLVAPLSLPGNEAEATFNGNAFVVNGNDTKMDGTPGSGSAVWGIGVAAGNTANETVVQNSLSNAQKNNVTGKPQNAGTGSGNNTIAPDPALNQAAIADFIAKVKSQANLTLTSTQASPLSFSGIGASCANDPASQTCWGTPYDPSNPTAPLNPKIVYIKGEPDPTSAFSALQVSGTSGGSGILIVEDGDFRISGNFRWDGIIIVTGQWVGVGYMGGGSQAVYGAVISNETATDPGFKEVLISGNAQLNYSTQAINLARQMRPLLVVTTWQEI